MPEFRYVNFEDDLTTSIFEALENNTALIFPTEKSCREARIKSQQNWQILQCSLLSIEEFKATVLYSAAINLMDEKRLICLYQALTEDDKRDLHIEKYPDIVDWGQHFFDFFGELAEECIEPETLLFKFEHNEMSYQDWQLFNLERLLRIRKQYKDFIQTKGYTDIIFDRKLQNLHPLSDISTYIIVNQYYYSALEKAIIRELEHKGHKVVVYWQGKAQWFDEPSMSALDFSLDDLYKGSKLPYDLKICQTNGHWQMALAFLAACQPSSAASEEHLIIDAKFSSQPYSTVFSPQMFTFSQPGHFIDSDIFVFLQSITEGLQNITVFNGKPHIKLDWLFRAIGIQGFCTYFRPNNPAVFKSEVLEYLCSLSENDVIYLDIDLDICNLKEVGYPSEHSRAFLSEVCALLMTCNKIESIQDFIQLIDSNQGIKISCLVAEEEVTGTKIMQCFYEALANFASIDTLNLVDDWRVLCPGMSVGAGIFDLFMQYLKPKIYQVFYPEQSGKRSIITNLMDTRNIQAAKVTFLNLVEGELPGQRTPVWLMNEHQCKEIGLKTWNDIRRWERYYFLRLISAAQEVQLYTISNQDNCTEPSSFLTELFIYATEHGMSAGDIMNNSEMTVKALLNSMIIDNPNGLLSQEPVSPANSPDSFFNLPYRPGVDFTPDMVVRLSWSSCERFLKDPIGYYIRDLRKLKPRLTEVLETMNRKMFGTLLHRYLMVITQRLADQNQGVLSMKWEWINPEFLRANLDHALAAPILKYQIPQNYNWEYLRELLSPFLIETAHWFFHNELGRDSDFQNTNIRLIPETEGMTMQEREYKILLDKETNAPGLTVLIRGIADLRLETTSKRFILDFKTGSADQMQLQFYMWFYYLIDHPGWYDSIRSAFYKLMDKEMDWLVQESNPLPSKLTDALKNSLEILCSSGFVPATEAKYKRYFMDISRADLMSRIALEEDDE